MLLAHRLAVAVMIVALSLPLARLANADKPTTMGLTEEEIFGLFDITARPKREKH